MEWGGWRHWKSALPLARNGSVFISSLSVAEPPRPASPNDVTMDGILSVQDVAQALRGKHVILTGGRTCEGYPVLTFPDSGAFCSDEDYRNIMQYLTRLPLPQDAQLGFVLVVDRRKDKWTAVKTVLLKISGYFPGVIQVVFVLKPAGFLQKALSEVSSKFFKEEFKFRLVMCSTLEELHEYIDPGQLTQDLGGWILYEHDQWIEQRLEVEKFSASLREVADCVRETTQQLRDTEMPNDVHSTLEFLRSHGARYQELKEKLMNSAQWGRQLWSRVQPPAVPHAARPTLINVCTVDRLLSQLNSTENGLDSFWSCHRKRLEECLELRRFEGDFRELQANMEANVRELASMHALGHSVGQVDALLQQLNDFHRLTQDDVEKAEQLTRTGERLVAEGHYAVDCIDPKCAEMQRMCTQFRQQLQDRMDILQRFRDLQARIDKANKWCSQGVQLLATLDVERCPSAEFARNALQELATFLSSSDEFHLQDPREFHRFFGDFVYGDMKPLLQQVLQRIEDVRLMCQNRQSSFQKLAAVRPVQAVAPEPSLRGDAAKKSNHTKPVDGCFSQGYETMEMLRDKRGHVMTELIETEKSYVSELHSVLQGYHKEMSNAAMKDLVPQSLRGKGAVLFGNMDSLYQFHATVFLQDLEDCRSTPLLVGRCFVQRRETFHKLYSTYCMNKPKSEALRRQCASDNAFFNECQRKLNHKLPLDAYLLKPVQRITKYQLLLKDLLKYSQGAQEQGQLQEAVQTMLQVLKHVNDSMHQVSITGFHGSLADYGKLLLQGMFNVWVETKQKKELRFKPSQRYIFLYEHLILFTKKCGRDPTYAFRNALKTSQIGLTENVKGSRGDRKKFEVWLRGRTQVFLIQAPSPESKELWVTHIKQVLLQQFEQLKGSARDECVEKRPDVTGGRLLVNGSPRVFRHTIGGTLRENDDERRKPLGRRATLPALPCYSGNSDHEDGWSTDDEADVSLASEVGDSYVALGDYEAVDVGEVSLHEGQHVQVQRVGCAGWWYVRCGQKEGWVPAAYLGPAKQSSSPFSQGKRAREARCEDTKVRISIHSIFAPRNRVFYTVTVPFVSASSMLEINK